MNLQQLLLVFWARKGLILAYLVVTMMTTLALSLLMPKQYNAHTSLVLDQPSINPITGERLSTQLTAAYMATQSDIIRSPKVALAVVDALQLEKDQTLAALFKKDETANDFRHWLADWLMKKLDVTPSRESSILGIDFLATDPVFSAQVANAFAQAYIQTANELKQQPAQQTADWFDKQLELLRGRVEKARAKLSNFQQVHGIIATNNEQIDMEDTKLRELSEQLIKSQLQTNELLSKKTLTNSADADALHEVLSNPVLQTLKADIARMEAKFADLAIHVDKNHPKYRQAAAEITNLKKQLKAETNTILHGVNSNIASSKQLDKNLANTVAKQKQKVLQLKQQHNEIAVLAREVDNAQQAYDTVMQRSIQTRMESDIKQSNVAVLDKAIPPKVVSQPKIKLNMILSVLLGSIIGIGAALFAEIMDRRVRSVADISNTLDLPVFGVLTPDRPTKK